MPASATPRWAASARAAEDGRPSFPRPVAGSYKSITRARHPTDSRSVPSELCTVRGIPAPSVDRPSNSPDSCRPAGVSRVHSADPGAGTSGRSSSDRLLARKEFPGNLGHEVGRVAQVKSKQRGELQGDVSCTTPWLTDKIRQQTWPSIRMIREHAFGDRRSRSTIRRRSFL